MYHGISQRRCGRADSKYSMLNQRLERNYLIKKSMRPLSFAVWKTFTTVYAQEAGEDDFLDVSIILPTTFSLPRGIETGTAWLTEMHIEIDLVSYQDMIGLSGISSLAVLVLHGPIYCKKSEVGIVHDRLMRDWARLAEESDAFANLRILSLHRCRNFSLCWLEYLRAFARLQRVYSDSRKYNSDGEFSAMKCTTVEGWTHYDVEKESTQNKFLLDSIFGSSHPAIGNIYSSYLSWYEHILRSLQAEELKPEDQKDLRTRYPVADTPSGALTTTKSTPVYDLCTDHKKPILSVLHGKQTYMDKYPLAYKRTESTARPRLFDQQSVGMDKRLPSPTTQATETSYKRPIKRTKFNDKDDFAQMLG